MPTAFNINEHIIKAAHVREYPRGLANSQDDQLLLHVKQYTPRDNLEPRKGDTTIIGAHGNGLPKELYEALWDDFYHEAKKHGVRIRDIWIADAAHQGQSGILNKEKLGNDPGWLDYARDILHMINTFRPRRPLLAIGHSFGANALANVSLLHPRLFNGMVLLDPVIARFAGDPQVVFSGPAAMSTYRRDTWPSTEAAAQSFKKSKFYQTWDPRVLDRWMEYGVRTVPKSNDGDEVALTTTKDQEVCTFIRPAWPAFDEEGKKVIHPELIPDIANPAFPVYRAEGPNTLSRLPNLRPGILYVFGGESKLSPPESIREKMEITGTGVGGSGGAKVGRVKQIVAKDYGHLVPLEAPQLCARAAAEFATEELDRWWRDEKVYEEWTRKPLVEKSTIDNRWRKFLAEGVQAKPLAKM